MRAGSELNGHSDVLSLVHITQMNEEGKETAREKERERKERLSDCVTQNG